MKFLTLILSLLLLLGTEARAAVATSGMIPTNSLPSTSLFPVSVTNAAGGYVQRSVTVATLAGALASAAAADGTNVIYVQANGNDATGTRNNAALPFRTVYKANLAARSGDTIICGAGDIELDDTVFDHNVSMTNNVNLIGQGMTATRLINRFELNAYGPGINPGDNSFLSGFTVENIPTPSTNYQAAIGCWQSVAGNHSFTNVLIRDVRVIGDSDGFYFNNTASNRLSVRVQDCIADSKWDAIVVFGNNVTNTVVELGNVTACSLWPSTISPGVSRALVVYSATVKMYGGLLRAVNAPSNTVGLAVQGTNSSVFLANVSYDVTSTNGLINQITNTLAGGIVTVQGLFPTNTVNVTNSILDVHRLFVITNDVISTNVGTVVSMLSNYLGTTTIPANYLTPGMQIRVSLLGQYWQPVSSGGPLNATNAVTLGGTVIATNHFPLIASIVNGSEFRHEFTITCRSTGASGSIYCQGTRVQAGTATDSIGQNQRTYLRSGAVTVDTTAALTLDFTCHGTNTTAFWIRSGYAEIIP